MDPIDSFYQMVCYGGAGFLGLAALVLLFGRRVETRWDLEARFRDERGRELGEFDIELRRVVREGSDWELSTRFVLRHPALEPGAVVELMLEGAVVLRGCVERRGRIALDERHLQIELKSPAAGQICSVHVGDVELFAEPLVGD